MRSRTRIFSNHSKRKISSDCVTAAMLMCKNRIHSHQRALSAILLTFQLHSTWMFPILKKRVPLTRSVSGASTNTTTLIARDWTEFRRRTWHPIRSKSTRKSMKQCKSSSINRLIQVISGAPSMTRWEMRSSSSSTSWWRRQFTISSMSFPKCKNKTASTHRMPWSSSNPSPLLYKSRTTIPAWSQFSALSSTQFWLMSTACRYMMLRN